MRVYRFEISETWHVVAASPHAALKHLVTCGCLDGFMDDDDTLEWSVEPDNKPLTIHFEDEPEEREKNAAGATWDAEKRTLTMWASGWADLYTEPAVIGQSDY